MTEEKKEICGLCPIHRLLSRLAGSEAVQHLLRAKKEVLLALRAALDARIEALEEKAQRLEKIEVE